MTRTITILYTLTARLYCTVLDFTDWVVLAEGEAAGQALRSQWSNRHFCCGDKTRASVEWSGVEWSERRVALRCAALIWRLM
jgi:hypothetical protein